jgi:PAS domain S-box-containing protein
MQLEDTPRILPLVLAAAVTDALGIYAWRRRGVPGAAAFAILMLAISVWSLGYALELAAGTLGSKLLWAKVEYLGIVATPPAWLAFALGYTGLRPLRSRTHLLTPVLRPGLVALPLTTALLAWTNDWHGLLWRHIALERTGRLLVLELEHGPWFWVHAAYSYVLLLVGTLVLVLALWRSWPAYRRQAGVLVLGILAPWAGNALYLSGHSPVADLDPTPFAFTFSGLALAWGVFRYSLLDLVPVAREAALEAMRDGVIVLDLHGRVVDINPAALRFIGRPAEELIGRPVHLVHEMLASALPRQQEGGPDAEGTRAEFTVEHGGRPASYELETAPLRRRDGRLAGRLVILHDVTERTRAEVERARRLREQAARAEAETMQRRLALLAEVSRVLSSPVEAAARLEEVARLCVPELGAVCIIDLVTEHGDITRAAVACTGPAQSGLAERLRRCVPDPCQEPALAEVLRTGTARLLPGFAAPGEAMVGDVGQEGPDKERDLGAAMIAPLLAHGRVLGAITIAAGEPGRNYTPADLALLDDLAGRAGLALENARLYHEAQQALQVRDDFLASIAHDLRSPLATIKGYTQLLQLRLGRLDLPEAQRLAEMLRRIDATVGRMSGFLTELLDLSRLRTGQPLALQRERVALVALVRQLLLEHQQTAPSHRLSLVASVPELVGWWDRLRLERALSNLLSNAVKYSPQGGEITVSIARQLDNGQEWAVLAVQDQGIGIPAEDLPHIFERFYRGRNVAGKIGGTGIGLASARAIVEQHGGTLTVQSIEGQGAVFTVRLPIVSGEQAGTASGR